MLDVGMEGVASVWRGNNWRKLGDEKGKGKMEARDGLVEHEVSLLSKLFPWTQSSSTTLII